MSTRTYPYPLILGLALSLACSAPKVRQSAPTSPSPIHELWQEPADLARLDLFHGPGGPALAPNPSGRFHFLSEDTTGASRGYSVRDEQDRKWDVKIGIEAQPEVVVSRLLWAIGFHQPPVYLVPGDWTLSGAPGWLAGGHGPQPHARFRPELPAHDVIGDWSWYENPFVDTREYKGLLVANLLLGNWDFKTSNNKIYRISEPDRAAGQRFVVRDLGAALGRHSPTFPRWLRIRGGQGSKNDVQGFEEAGFITAVRGDRVEFEYRGIDAPLFEEISTADVRWTTGLFARLSDDQLHDAFRAAGYDRDTATRYIRKIRQRVAEGSAL